MADRRADPPRLPGAVPKSPTGPVGDQSANVASAPLRDVVNLRSTDEGVATRRASCDVCRTRGPVRPPRGPDERSQSDERPAGLTGGSKPA